MGWSWGLLPDMLLHGCLNEFWTPMGGIGRELPCRVPYQFERFLMMVDQYTKWVECVRHFHHRQRKSQQKKLWITSRFRWPLGHLAIIGFFLLLQKVRYFYWPEAHEGYARNVDGHLVIWRSYSSSHCSMMKVIQ